MKQLLAAVVLLFSAVAARGQGCVVNVQTPTSIISLSGSAVLSNSLVTNSSYSGLNGANETVNFGLSDSTAFTVSGDRWIIAQVTEFDLSTNGGNGSIRSIGAPGFVIPANLAPWYPNEYYFFGLTNGTDGNPHLTLQAQVVDTIPGGYKYTNETQDLGVYTSGYPYWFQTQVNTTTGTVNGFISPDGGHWTNIANIASHVGMHANSTGYAGVFTSGFGVGTQASIYLHNLTFDGSAMPTNFVVYDNTAPAFQFAPVSGVAVPDIQPGILGVAVTQESGTVELNGSCSPDYFSNLTVSNALAIGAAGGTAQLSFPNCNGHATCYTNLTNPLNYPHSQYVFNVYHNNEYFMSNETTVKGATPPGYIDNPYYIQQILFKP